MNKSLTFFTLKNLMTMLNNNLSTTVQISDRVTCHWASFKTPRQSLEASTSSKSGEENSKGIYCSNLPATFKSI